MTGVFQETTSKQVRAPTNTPISTIYSEEGRGGGGGGWWGGSVIIDVMNGKSGSRFEIQIFLSLYEGCGSFLFISLHLKASLGS